MVKEKSESIEKFTHRYTVQTALASLFQGEVSDLKPFTQNKTQCIHNAVLSQYFQSRLTKDKQEDAAELITPLLEIEPFLSYSWIIDVVQTYKEKDKSLAENFVENSIQQFWESGKRQFDVSNYKEGRFENSMNIEENHLWMLPIQSNDGKSNFTSLNECIGEYFNAEQIHQETSTKHLYWRIRRRICWPPMLVIQLKRFYYTKSFFGNHKRGKLSHFVSIPFTFACDEEEYELLGFICHRGNVFGGHYYSYAYENKVWRKYNDDNEPEIIRRSYEELNQSFNSINPLIGTAYILIYKRKTHPHDEPIIPPPVTPTTPVSLPPSPPKPPPPAPTKGSPPTVPPTAPPTGPTLTAPVEFCRDPIVSDPVPSTDLVLQKLPWNRNMPNPNIGNQGLANDCWFNSIFQIMVRTPIAQRIVHSDEVYSNPVLQSIKEELIRLFTEDDYFAEVSTDPDHRKCGVIRAAYMRADHDRRNRIGKPNTDLYFLSHLLEVEPFKSNTKYDEVVFGVPDKKISEKNYIQYTPVEGNLLQFDVGKHLQSQLFHVDKELYVLKLDMRDVFFHNIPETFLKSENIEYSLFGFTIDLGGHFAAAVLNLEDRRWYYFDDTKRKPPVHCDNMRPIKDDSTNTYVLSFDSLAHLINCPDIQVNSSKLLKGVEVDARKTLVYIKRLRLPVSHGEETKESELPLSRPVLQEIPWNQILPNPHGNNDCWFNSVIQVMVRLPFAQYVVNAPQVSSQYSFEDVHLNTLRSELSNIFTQPDSFSTTKNKNGHNVTSARCAISEKYELGNFNENVVFLNDILEIEPFKSQTKFILEHSTKEFHLLNLDTAENDDNIEVTPFKTIGNFKNKTDYGIDSNFNSENFIDLTRFLQQLKFTKTPNLFIVSIGSLFVNNDVPESIYMSGFKFVLIAFTSVVQKELNGIHYVASVRNPNGLWYYYDDEQLDIKHTIADLMTEHPSIYAESNFPDAPKVDNRNILFYLKDPQDPLPAALTKRRIVPLEESDDGDYSGNLQDVDE